MFCTVGGSIRRVQVNLEGWAEYSPRCIFCTAKIFGKKHQLDETAQQNAMDLFADILRCDLSADRASLSKANRTDWLELETELTPLLQNYPEDPYLLWMKATVLGELARFDEALRTMQVHFSLFDESR